MGPCGGWEREDWFLQQIYGRISTGDVYSIYGIFGWNNISNKRVGVQYFVYLGRMHLCLLMIPELSIPLFLHPSLEI